MPRRRKSLCRKLAIFVTSSRLAYAICRPVLEYVKYCPSWSKRADFEKYSGGPNSPFRYMGGSYNASNPHSRISIVTKDGAPWRRVKVTNVLGPEIEFQYLDMPQASHALKRVISLLRSNLVASE